MTTKRKYSDPFLKPREIGSRFSLRRLFLNPYTIEILVGMFIAIFSSIFALECHRRSESRQQTKEVIHMLENIISEIDYNIQRTDLLLPKLEEGYQDTLIVYKDLLLSTGAFNAASTTGQLTYIPQYAFALIVYYQLVNRINRRLENLQQMLGIRSSLDSLEKKNLKMYINHTIYRLNELKKVMYVVRNNIDKNKSRMAKGKGWAEIKYSGDTTITIFHRTRQRKEKVSKYD